MKFLVGCFLLLLVLSYPKAQDVPCNEDNSLLFDNAKVLKWAERKNIKQRLDKLNDSLYIKIYFVLVDTLNGIRKDVYVKKIIEEWNILKLPTAKEMLVFASIKDKKLMIEVSPAMNKSFSEAAALDIMNNLLAPGIIKKEYYKTINKSIDEILKYHSGYYKGPVYSPNYDHSLDRKWYLLRSYDFPSLVIILGMLLVFNIFVYIKYMSKPLGIYLLYQSLWHVLGSLNIFFYIILIMKNLDPDFSVYIFNILLGILHIFVLFKSDGLIQMRKYLKAWVILFIVTWVLTVTVITLLSYDDNSGLLGFLPNIYYGFLFNMILISVGILQLSRRGSSNKGSKMSNNGSGSSDNGFGSGSSGGGGASGSW